MIHDWSTVAGTTRCRLVSHPPRVQTQIAIMFVLPPQVKYVTDGINVPGSFNKIKIMPLIVSLAAQSVG